MAITMRSVAHPKLIAFRQLAPGAEGLDVRLAVTPSCDTSSLTTGLISWLRAAGIADLSFRNTNHVGHRASAITQLAATSSSLGGLAC
jgi:hypothetical protein